MIPEITIKVFSHFFSAKYKSEWKTPLGEAGCVGNPYFLLTDCLGIQFLIHYAALGDLQDTMQCHWSHRCFSPLLPREAKDFPRGDKYFKHVPLPTYIVGLIYMPRSPHRALISFLLVLNQHLTRLIPGFSLDLAGFEPAS